MQRIQRRQDVGVDLLELSCRRSACAGHYVAAISCSLWLVAGAIYHWHLNEQLSAIDSIHFFLGLQLCGLIAVAYPFFLLTSVCIRRFHPILLQQQRELTGVREASRLNRIAHATSLYLGLTVLIPILALAALLVSGQAGDASERPMTVVLVTTGVGFAWVFFRLNPMLQRHISTLTGILSRGP